MDQDSEIERAPGPAWVKARVASRTQEPRLSGTSGDTSGWWPGRGTGDSRTSSTISRSWRRSRTLTGMPGGRSTSSTTTTRSPEFKTSSGSLMMMVMAIVLEMSSLTESWGTSSPPPSWRWTPWQTSLITVTGWLTGESSWLLWDLTGRTEDLSLTLRGSMTRSRDKWPSALADRSSRSSKWAKENTGWVNLWGETISSYFNTKIF